ncbi:PAS domain-containing sensor histidine kinase [Olivibacter sp. XZL3]|uniref:PAS domain-containing sensor histidine kinase n=1 Tax=Olivibacter sp. XZL3 TaxID=1735116 RepID=UPI001066A18C|nr:PAS domain-containing sensor histidine kinase [Olivibacter sp. XZL3]
MEHAAELLLSLVREDNRYYFIFDIAQKRFLFVNPAFESFFHVRSGETEGDSLIKMIHPDDVDYLKSHVQSAQPGLFLTDIEFRIIHFDKKEYIFSMSARLEKKHDKKLISGYLSDITRQKENALYLNEFNNRKNSILNILAHDLGGPLGNIKNLSHLLKQRFKSLDEENLQKIITSIERNTNMGIQIINDFLNREFIEAVGVQLLKTRVNLIEKMESIIMEYQQSQSQTGKAFFLETNSTKIYVEIDENKFFQALTNLISNALKFTPDGGSIRVEVLELAETVLIAIKDDGIGIPQKFQKQLFDKFSGAGRPGLKGERSTGLGMSIIKTIIDWHQGKIWFDS